MLANLALFFIEGLDEGSNDRKIVFLLGIFVADCAERANGDWCDLRQAHFI